MLNRVVESSHRRKSKNSIERIQFNEPFKTVWRVKKREMKIVQFIWVMIVHWFLLCNLNWPSIYRGLKTKENKKLESIHVSLFKWIFSQFLVGIFESFAHEGYEGYVYEKYPKNYPYSNALEASGATGKIDEYDRLVEVLSSLGDLDYGMIESWNAKSAAKPHYVGCEPMQKRRHSLHCDIPLSQQSRELGWRRNLVKWICHHLKMNWEEKKYIWEFFPITNTSCFWLFSWSSRNAVSIEW